jgi:CCR4-NOT transcriptional regulation complex NOT5 subunit
LLTDERRPVVRVTTGGCGCCEGSDDIYKKDDALQALQEEEDDLKDDLKRLRAMRRKVKRWKS